MALDSQYLYQLNDPMPGNFTGPFPESSLDQYAGTQQSGYDQWLSNNFNNPAAPQTGGGGGGGNGFGVSQSQAPGLIQSGLGLVEGIGGLMGLNNLNKQAFPQFSLNGDLSDYASMTRSRAQQGFSPEETAAFKQNLAQSSNAAYQNATNLGGGSAAKAISAGLAGQNIGALNQFAASGAQLKNQHMQQYGSAASELQQQQNLKTQADIAMRNKLETAYGGALQSGLNNFTGGLSNVAGMGVLGQAAGGLGSLLPLLL